MKRLLFAGLMSAALAACAAAPQTARFDWFAYSGSDPVRESVAAGPNDYLNPILQGFYPDPSITQVGADYYLVTSTFAYFPGIPVLHSRDLVNWTQLGNAIDRPGMLDFGTLGLSRGVFAPTIDHHDGVFYIANTCVDCGGNFILRAENPAGPWSDPIWIPDVGGIDPSLFFDEDGAVYLMNNDAPPGPPQYDGHRAIWIRQIDPQTLQPISEARVLIDGGVRFEEKPIWIEGPHIYKHGEYYYLSAAEGGTAEGHSQVILRGRHPLGPFEAFPGNPILTQRHMDRARPHPITSVGHADYVQTPDGAWWVTFLGVRPYEGDYYNTGRETFLMPVRWVDGWPIITEGAEAVPYAHARPNLPPQAAPALPMNGDFAVREEFDAPLGPHWMRMRAQSAPWLMLDGGMLALEARPVSLGAFSEPSFVARRQQHMNAAAETVVRFSPRGDSEAGLAALQSDEFYFFLAVGAEGGERVVRLRRRAGDGDPERGVVIASAPLPGDAQTPVRLRISARGPLYDFAYAVGDDEWTVLAHDADGRILSTRRAGGFVGAVFGLHAYAGADQ